MIPSYSIHLQGVLVCTACLEVLSTPETHRYLYRKKIIGLAETRDNMGFSSMPLQTRVDGLLNFPEECLKAPLPSKKWEW